MTLSQRTADLGGGIVCLLIGAFYLYIARTTLLFWTPGNQPGAGFFPTLLGIGVVGISCLLIARGLRTPPGAGETRNSIHWESFKRPVYVFIAMIIGIVLFEILGYVVAMWLCVGGLMWAFIPASTLRRRAAMSIGVSGAAVWGFYLLFAVGFGLQLPRFLNFLY
jgi:hypothetical protein